MAYKKIQCKCKREFESMAEYSEHFREVQKRIGKQKQESVVYGVDRGRQLEGKSGNDTMIIEVIADHQIMRTDQQECTRF